MPGEVFEYVRHGRITRVGAGVTGWTIHQHQHALGWTSQFLRQFEPQGAVRRAPREQLFQRSGRKPCVFCGLRKSYVCPDLGLGLGDRLG